MEQKKYTSEAVTVVKITSSDLILLSKFLADLRSRFNVLSISRIMVNSSSQLYFCYVNIDDAEIAQRLQEVSPYPPEAVR